MWQPSDIESGLQAGSFCQNTTSRGRRTWIAAHAIPRPTRLRCQFRVRFSHCRPLDCGGEALGACLPQAGAVATLPLWLCRHRGRCILDSLPARPACRQVSWRS